MEWCLVTGHFQLQLNKSASRGLCQMTEATLLGQCFGGNSSGQYSCNQLLPIWLMETERFVESMSSDFRDPSMEHHIDLIAFLWLNYDQHSGIPIGQSWWSCHQLLMAWEVVECMLEKSGMLGSVKIRVFDFLSLHGLVCKEERKWYMYHCILVMLKHRNSVETMLVLNRYQMIWGINAWGSMIPV